MPYRPIYDGIFFDLDDTLIEGYMEPRQPYARVVALPGRKERLHQLLAEGVKIGIASNQAGVAFGFINPLDVATKAIAVSDLFNLPSFRRPDGVLILTSFYHPNATVESYRSPGLASWRKPEPGMLLALAQHYALYQDRCLYVGDRDDDRQAAQNAGMDFMPADQFFSSPDLRALINDPAPPQALEGTPEEIHGTIRNGIATLHGSVPISENTQPGDIIARISPAPTPFTGGMAIVGDDSPEIIRVPEQANQSWSTGRIYTPPTGTTVEYRPPQDYNETHAAMNDQSVSDRDQELFMRGVRNRKEETPGDSIPSDDRIFDAPHDQYISDDSQISDPDDDLLF